MSPLIEASIFLVQTIFSLFVFILLIRILMQITHCNFYNPLAQFVLRVTNPVVSPFRSIIPNIRSLDLAALTVTVLMEVLKLLLVGWLRKSAWLPIGGLLIWAIGELFGFLIDLYFFAIIIVVIVSWLSPNTHNPTLLLLQTLVSPLLNFARRYVPVISGFDLSPLAVLLALKLIEILLIDPIMVQGIKMAMVPGTLDPLMQATASNW